MHHQFWLPFFALAFCIGFFERKHYMLRDLSQANKKPYSWARVQLAWWSVIILSSFIAILWKRGTAPELTQSTIILLSISAATIASARIIDVSEEADEKVFRSQDEDGNNFFLDILSDGSGVSIHRFQTIVFNLAFGCWFIDYVLTNLVTASNINNIIPEIGPNNLVLLGVSSATYIALKTTENKTSKAASADAEPDVVQDENPTPELIQG